eukprot:scaffold39417_cov176-Amphora_coffeaeformis.AAC.1
MECMVSYTVLPWYGMVPYHTIPPKSPLVGEFSSFLNSLVRHGTMVAMVGFVLPPYRGWGGTITPPLVAISWWRLSNL